MTTMTVLGFDFGTKSIGVAVGQNITFQASPEQAVKANDGIPDWNVIETIIKRWKPNLLVIGLPLNMDGTEQPLTLRAKKFANRLHGRFGIEIALQDERLTTTDAKARLFELGGFKKLSKDQVDSVSAVLIVESYFENHYS
ncbi:Holliday junction resolvase RuvX [Parashewanella spongiae]|uniref:Putative pre-16S rRNA nuclease n=1 Tax=Parashewanella spongiae TaxID=342950 RepID=A0A3A6TQY7_9GAMM|nr:Holliday junction resolvase RuvX [Parashewanella spongiae]MCL1078303.1 Holliday junction resolvase RuvX [Parashewanella spongiae]RJY15027.1 Holliday junction resolvase RuvX [Parashewanella spongiae]